VLAGVPVTEVAGRYGVSRQSVHAWLGRYRDEGPLGLEDRSHKVRAHPWQIPAELESAICELRRAHRKWGPKRLVFEMGRRGHGVVTRSTVYRVLIRNQLIEPRSRRRRRQDYVRWERPVPMQLWQLDVTASAFLADGAEVKIVTGLDDHSRYCVIARAVRRATARPVCRAFVDAMAVYGVPEEVLTDNGTVFTGRFIKPRPAEVLFERICRENGITARRTRPRSPTTTGKIERLHQSLQARTAGRARPVRVAGSAAGRTGCMAGGVQHRPAAPVAGHGLPRVPVHSGGIAAAAAGAVPADRSQHSAG
jgi:transposase InsO family protein